MKNRKIISLIPNLLTTLAMVFGLLSIFNLIKLFPLVDGEFLGIETSLLTEKSLWWSCIFLYIAAFIDFVDGKIARLLNKDSEFGAQYDSLSDLVCFGVAPSLLIYIVYLSSFNNPQLDFKNYIYNHYFQGRVEICEATLEFDEPF